ncbi:MAG: Uma2 family endonuclease [Oscillatoriaceae cyanobacterium]
MTLAEALTNQLPVTQKEIPPLDNGDCLNQYEFERRYHAMPHVKKAELIEGVVYMPSPLRFHSHAKPHLLFNTWLGVYFAGTPGVEAGDNPTVRLDLDNQPQPDAVLRLSKGGSSSISDDDYIEGAPELIAEIAASTASYDLHQKKNAYRRNGVQEYIVWEMFENRLLWFRLSAGEYIEMAPDEQGIIRSVVFPGLWLDVPALLQGNLGAVLAAVQLGINSQEHGEFVQKISG